MDKEKTGEYIRALRKNKGWTQMQLAEQLHISDKAVSKWERGISFPDIELMEELAQVFQVDVADIIRGEEAGRAEHTVNELVKDTIDIAKREKKRQIRKYRWVLCILFVLFGVLIGYSVENIQKNYILEYHLCMNAVVESKGEVIYVRETDANGKNPGKVYRLAQDDAKKGYVLDGFPRTIPQAEALTEALAKIGEKMDYAINVEVPDENIIDRMSGRRACVACGGTYHIKYNPTKKEGICDACGGELILRDDDKPETVKQRLEVYHTQTQPLIDYYTKEGILKEVDGTQDLQKVFDDITAILG